MTGTPEPGRLCQQCATIDFHRLLSDAVELELRWPMVEIPQDTDCPFCRLMIACWEDYEPKDGETKDFGADICKVAFSSKIELSGFQEDARVLNIGFSQARVGYWFEKYDTRQSPRRLVDRMFDVERLREWLQDCDRHSSMQMTRVASIRHEAPFRVIDTHEDRVMVLQEALQYVALSYAWGSRREKPYRPAMSDRINRTALPATIRDSMDLTQAIGLRYIWIDYLCIDQSQPDEVSVVLNEMGKIYENAYLTIVAASGDSVESGLSRLRAPPGTGMTQQVTSFMSHEKPVLVVLSAGDLYEALEGSIWASRGWTYQEYVMSSRSVIITEHEVFFECCHGTRRREAYEPLLSNSCPSPTFERHWDGIVNEGWRSEKRGLWGYCLAVEAFSQCKLTYDGDRLDAFVGVYRRFNPRSPPTERAALSGLPLKGFREALCWFSNTHKDSNRITIDTRMTRYLPSWSWVGWQGRASNSLAVDSPDASPHFEDACNIVLALSSSQEPWPRPLVLTKPQVPSKIALHLRTACLRVIIEYVPLNDYGVSDGLAFTVPLLGRIRIAISSSPNPNRAHLSAIPRADSTHWLALVYENTSAWKWLLLEGDDLDAERIGIVEFDEDNQSMLRRSAFDKYMSIF